MSDLPHLLFVLGPTACGKSDFAVELSERVGAKVPAEPLPEIINCDSVQFFKGVDIGAAKPEPELLARAPHHLISHLPLGRTYTAGDFRRDALEVIAQRSAAGISRFIPVGGSGFYVQALEKGMFDVPDIPDRVRSQLEQDLKTKGLEALYAELQQRDPETAAKIKPTDTYRIPRALEVLRSSPEGRRLSQIKEEFEKNRPPPPFQVSKIGLFRPRDILRVRVIERTRRMLQNGLIDEVKALRDKGYGAWAPMRSVGYHEVQEMLDGKLNDKDLEGAIVTSTMQLAKRQMTWFKKDPTIHWFNIEQGMSAPLQKAVELLH